ncbi:uncharacterized protein RSE6_02242 [Rhynchosporium secalis]|uniref:Uncharacterized protein n=1 Tax=Rhynchosporium secalis TaxID=38038 RepID=A0A1E1LZU7_RHYSE|nr:uncharacterized protein RSE6_02242 [Rhynchosporium secalis]
MPWNLGYNPINPLFHLHYQPLPPPASYKPRYTSENPSPYYLEQAAFYLPPTRSDPFALPPPPLPSIFTGFHLEILTISLYILKILLAFLLALLGYVLGMLELGAEVFNVAYEAFTSQEMAAFALAWWLVERLPGWKKSVLEEMAARRGLGLDEPVYRIFMAGREALGTGSVRWE